MSYFLQKNHDVMMSQSAHQDGSQTTTDSAALIQFNDRAFQYGDGCFTTMAVIDGQPCLWSLHRQRLQRAISVLQLQVTLGQIEEQLAIALQGLRQGSASAAELWYQSDGILKILISRGPSARGYAVPDQPADVYYQFHPAKLIPERILSRVGICPEPLAEEFGPLRGLKTLNRLPQVWLRHHATQQHWEEMLCFDRKGHWVEGIASNVFFFLDGLWQTPDLALTGIAGVMRQHLLNQMAIYGIPHRVGNIDQQALMRAEAAFLCNALQPMQVIAELDAKNLSGVTAVIPLDQVKCRQLWAQLDSQRTAICDTFI